MFPLRKVRLPLIKKVKHSNFSQNNDSHHGGDHPDSSSKTDESSKKGKRSKINKNNGYLNQYFNFVKQYISQLQLPS